ncbi:MAG: 2-octaprenyl-6-methoxyphenyl hydroxylase [Woeseia sp.]
MGDSRSDYDLVIAGGGMVGCCLALALAPLGLRIAVVEAVQRGALRQPSFDDRSTALSRSSQRMFAAMQLWPEIAAASVPIASIHVSDRGSFGFSHIEAAHQGVEALGYVVINRVLGEVLQKALSALDGVDLFCPARISEVDPGHSEAQVVADGAGGRQKLRCRLLVAADGANSAVREMLGITASQLDYGQCAVTGNLLPEKPPANRAWERFTHSGPLALLPLQGERAAFVWTLSSADADDVMQLSDSDFLLRLQQAFGWRLGTFDKAGERISYPLALTRAARLTARRSVLIGNAANGLHPVAAQGFNLGLRDVAALCDCIADAMAAGDRKSIGNDDMLRSYAEWRRADHRKVTLFTDGLVRLFGSRSAPVRAMRGLGMLGFDLVPGVRSLFARHTMGLAGRLPALSRGLPLTSGTGR